MSNYESIYIVRPDLSAEQTEKVLERVRELYEQCGAEILSTENWGRRALAYPVKKNSKGLYVFYAVKASGETVRQVEDKLNILEDVLKYLNVRVGDFSEGMTPLGDEQKRRESGELTEEDTRGPRGRGPRGGRGRDGGGRGGRPPRSDDRS